MNALELEPNVRSKPIDELLKVRHAMIETWTSGVIHLRQSGPVVLHPDGPETNEKLLCQQKLLHGPDTADP